MFKSFLTFIFLLFSILSFAQVMGITASKMNAFNHTPIDLGRAEFEPTFNLTRYSQAWNNDGDLQNIFASPDSIVIDGNISLRMAYTFTEKLEFGANLGDSFSNWSAKYAIGTYDKIGLGVFAGANFPFGFATLDRKIRTEDQIGTYGLGLIFSYELSETTSFDFNVQYQDYFHENDQLPNSDLFLMIDYGHYVGDVLLVASFIYQNSPGQFLDQNKLTFSPGVSFEMKEEYMAVLNLNLDLIGKNTEKTNGLAVSWTMTF